MMPLILSTAALLAGPILCWVSRDHAIARRVINGVVILTIAAIIGFDVVPMAVKHGGVAAVLVIILGIAFPLVLERLFRSATDTAHLIVVAIATFGIMLHAVIDGIAILPDSGSGLAHAVVLHRIPVGMALWWAVRPSFGTAITITLFVCIVAATAAGYFIGEPMIAMAETRTIALLQAFVSGSLIHVIAFGVKHEHH